MSRTIDVSELNTAALFSLADLALHDARWNTARIALDELGQRFDDLTERLEHRRRTSTLTRPEGATLPLASRLAPESELPPNCAAILDARVEVVNGALVRDLGGEGGE